MKRKDISSICMKLCISFFLFWGISDSIFSKEDNKGEKTTDNILLQTVVDSARNTQSHHSSVVKNGCVSVFKDKNVSSVISVLGCDSLFVQNVTIINGGNLTLSAPGDVTLNGLFVGELGSILNIKAEDLQYVFEFFYDASGNREMRQVSVVESDI